VTQSLGAASQAKPASVVPPMKRKTFRRDGRGTGWFQRGREKKLPTRTGSAEEGETRAFPYPSGPNRLLVKGTILRRQEEVLSWRESERDGSKATWSCQEILRPWGEGTLQHKNKKSWNWQQSELYSGKASIDYKNSHLPSRPLKKRKKDQLSYLGGEDGNFPRTTER